MSTRWSFWTKLSPRKKRLYSFLFILILTIVVTIIGALVPTTPQQAKEITDQVNQTVIDNKASGALAPSIFLNNFPICLLMFIPIAGAVIGLVILFNTGYILGAEIRYTSTLPASNSSVNLNPTTAILILVFAAATFACEYISYAIGMTESIWLFRRLLQRRWRELKYTGILIGITAVLLTIGAIVEAYSLYLG